MKITYNDWLNKGIEEYLLSQEGIEKVNITENNKMDTITIEYNNKTNPYIISKYIDLYQENNYSKMFSFSKEEKDNYKELKYIISDICCEYCYMSFIEALFNKKELISVESDCNIIDNHKKITLVVKYEQSCTEEEIIRYIEEHL